MKNILIMIDTLNGGGAEKILLDIIRNINKEKYKITVAAIWEKGVYVESINKVCKSIFLIKKNNSSNKLLSVLCKLKNTLFEWIYKYSSGKILYRLFIKQNYDVEIAFLEGLSTKIISGSTNKKSKKYCWIHIDMDSNNWYKQFYKDDLQFKRTYEKYDKVIGVSQSCIDSFKNKTGINNIQVIYNPVDEADIRSKSLLCNTYEKYKDNKVIKVVTVGRLTKQKGYDRLLRVHHRLYQEGIYYELLIIGTGEMESELIDMINDFNISKNTHLLGYQDNPYNILNYCDLFVCSSRAEGYSTVITEALVLGLPVITTRCAGMEELLGNSQYGLIVKNSEECLYQGLKKMITDTQLLGFYKEKAKSRGDMFTLERSIVDIENLLNNEG